MDKKSSEVFELLPTHLSVSGRELKQLIRSEKAAIYEVYGANGLLYGYEVIAIKRSLAREVFGKNYPNREVYPGNEDWGRLAWSYGPKNRAEAEQVFEHLTRAG